MYARPLHPPYRILIVDDHKFLAELLARRLSQDAELRIVGIANVGSAALDIVAKQDVDLVLLDMHLAQEDGIGIAKLLFDCKPALRIIGLSMCDADYHPSALLQIGARGFISKNATTREICEAVQRVARGDMAVSPHIAVHLATNRDRGSVLESLRALTVKEIEILTGIANGLSVAEIAHLNRLTERTVRTHRSNLRQKLQLTTDAQLCLLAIEAGLINLQQRPR